MKQLLTANTNFQSQLVNFQLLSDAQNNSADKPTEKPKDEPTEKTNDKSTDKPNDKLKPRLP